MSRVTVTVKDAKNQTAQSTVDYIVSTPLKVAGGIYFGGNADVRADTTNRVPPINITALQQYRSIADGSQYPGYQKTWIPPMVQNGVWLNLVVELKHYGATDAVQNFTVEGKSYSVPRPNGRVRLTLDNALAFGYEQVWTGQIDGLLHRLLSQLRAIPTGGRINIQLASEVDTDNANGGVVENGVTYSREDADLRAVRAYKYIAKWLREPPNGIAPIPQGVTLSMGYAGQWSGIAGFKNTHPEDLMCLLDYMHCNTYNHSSNWTAEARFREIVDWSAQLGPIGRSKGIIVSEFGSNAAYTPNQAGYMDQMPAAMNKLNGELIAAGRKPFVMTIWFGSNNDTWGTLNPKEGGLQGLQRMLDTPPYK
jgi:hypothetical protein